VERITSRQNAIVAQYRAAAHGDANGVVLLDGAHLVSDALAARIPLRHVMVGVDALNLDPIRALVDQAGERRIAIALASAKVIEAASPVRSSSPIIALADRAAFAGNVYASNKPFVLIACDVQDPGNVGAIARVAEAAGASGVVAAGASARMEGAARIDGQRAAAADRRAGQRR
jgi:RNA methyltransferase, TrmH family